MSTNGEAPQQGAESEEHPAWFTAYLQSLSIKREEVRAVEFDNVLQTCEDVSEVFRSNISAAYRTESRLEAARQAEREKLSQTILQTPVVYSAPYVEFPWSLISPEQGKICSRQRSRWISRPSPSNPGACSLMIFSPGSLLWIMSPSYQSFITAAQLHSSSRS